MGATLRWAADSTLSSHYQHSSPGAAVFTVAPVLTFLLCGGNGLVCFIVLNRHMGTVTMFILSLASLLVGIFCVPAALWTDSCLVSVGDGGRWPFDNTTCKMSGVQDMSVLASIFTLLAIAVRRRRCIVHPFCEKLALQKVLVTIAVTRALALLIVGTSAVTHEGHHFTVDTHNCSSPLCLGWEARPEKGARARPRALAKWARRAAGGRWGLWRKAKVVHMLVMVALSFTPSWLPLWALWLTTHCQQLSESQWHLAPVYSFPFAHWLAAFNSSANPTTHGSFNKNFCHGFQAAFPAWLCPLQ
ncbi:LOW QUALITY PROTEIN: neuropeptide FF receptor 1 [Glossophaga mutica]